MSESWHVAMRSPPGRWSTTAWSRRGTITDWIAHRAEPDALVLDYTTTGVTKSDGISIVERIPIERTPCHYGGSRPWFLCPGCGCRRAILYCVGDFFRCRTCHNLAYGLTRESAWKRKQRKAARLRRKIGAKPALHHRARKPKGMHWRTFRRIQYEITTLDR
jgi:hypothetical protein